MASPTSIPAEMLAWAGRPGPAAALLAARAKLEAGVRGPTARLPTPSTPEDRREVGRVVGLAWQTSQQALTLGRLRQSLAASGVELEDLLETTGGRLRDLPAERDLEQQRVATEEAELRSVLQGARVPDEVIDHGLAERWFGPRTGRSLLVARAVQVLIELPPARSTLLPEFASRVLGDPHALDRNHRLGHLVLRLHAGRVGDLEPEVRLTEPTAWRTAWASAGVACDRVSSLVLVLNLVLPSGPGGGSPAALARGMPGEPLWLSYRDLSPASGPGLGSMAGCVVRVCENPSVVEAAADRLGVRCRPLMCTYGQTSVAGVALLRMLHAAGAELLISADRDLRGTAISGGLLSQLPGARPWLPEVPGLYEEDRLDALLADLAPT